MHPIIRISDETNLVNTELRIYEQGKRIFIMAQMMTSAKHRNKHMGKDFS